GDVSRIFEAEQRSKGGLDDVVRIRGAERLGQHIVNSRNLHDLANGSAGDNARAFRGRLEQNLRGTVAANDLMRNRGALEVQLDQILFRLLDALLDGHRHFARLAHAETSVAMAVADNNERGEAEVLAALDDFGDAVDGYDVVLQLRRIHFKQPAHRETLP